MAGRSRSVVFFFFLFTFFLLVFGTQFDIRRWSYGVTGYGSVFYQLQVSQNLHQIGPVRINEEYEYFIYYSRTLCLGIFLRPVSEVA